MSIESEAKETLKDYPNISNPVYQSNCFWMGYQKYNTIKVGNIFDCYGRYDIIVYNDCSLAQKKDRELNEKEMRKMIIIAINKGEYRRVYKVEKIIDFKFVVFTSKSATKWICFDNDNLYVIVFKDEEFEVRETIPIKVTSSKEAARIAKPFIEGKLKYNPKNYE